MGVGIDEIRSDIWRHRYTLRDVGLGVLVLGTGALVATVLTNGPGGSATLVASSSGRPAPTSSDEVLQPPTSTPPAEPGPADVTAMPTAAAAPTAPSSPTASPTATPRPTRSPSPTPRASRSAAPAAYPAKGLRLLVSATSDRSMAGQITVRVRDNDGTWNGGFIAFGDGQRQAFGRTRPSCEERSAPGDAKPTDVTRTFRHVYDTTGSYDVVVQVRTERFCSDAPVEEATKTVRLTISGTQPTPPPSPEPSEAPSEEPTAEPSPDGGSDTRRS